MFFAHRQRHLADASSARSHSTRTELLFLGILAAMLYGNLARLASQLVPQPALAFAVSQPVSPAVSSSAANAGADAATEPAAAQTPAQSSTAPVQPHIETTRPCTGNPYALPQALTLSGAQPGLTQKIDQPTTYTVYGSHVSDLRTAINECPLRAAAGPYHASTAYQLNWSYTPLAQNGVCSITQVKVGLHVNQLMPAFSPGSTVSPETTSTWNKYIAALQTHEDGHTAIDIDYAKRLTAALQNLGAMDCATLTHQVQTIVDSHVAMLNTANELYDAQTNHGTSQGAIL